MSDEVENFDLLRKKDIVDRLKQGVYSITFRKKDGEQRVLNGTLQSDVVVYPPKKTDRQNNKDPDSLVIRVFDVDINQWRSFDSTRVENFVKKGQEW